MNSAVWLRMADESKHSLEDLFEGQLQRLAVPTIFIHGGHDPRTEPGEIDILRQVLPRAPIQMITGGLHSPHSEKAVENQTNELAKLFLQKIQA